MASKKYNRTLHFDFSPGTTSDDRISHDISNLINKRVVITEKLDGENNGIERYGVYARSHADFTRNPWAVKTWELWQRIGRDISEGMTLFGENMYAIHSIEYHNLRSYFYLFGVRENDIWYSWKEVEETAYLLDIPTVPVLYDGSFSTELELKDKVLELVSKPSKLGSSIMEGCVVRIYDRFSDDEFDISLHKYVRKDHVKTDIHWTKNWRKANIKHY